MAARQDLTILKGATFAKVLRWETSPFITKAITAISQAAPAVVTATGHGLPNGWRAAIVSAGGMEEINATKFPPRQTEFKTGTVLTANTVAFNDINSSEFTAYTSGGFLVYYTPHDLTSYTARMSIRSTINEDTVLLSLTTANSRIAIDSVGYTITLTISATDTDAIDWASGVYDLELVSPDATPIVTRILEGSVQAVEEVTR